MQNAGEDSALQEKEITPQTSTTVENAGGLQDFPGIENIDFDLIFETGNGESSENKQAKQTTTEKAELPQEENTQHVSPALTASEEEKLEAALAHPQPGSEQSNGQRESTVVDESGILEGESVTPKVQNDLPQTVASALAHPSTDSEEEDSALLEGEREEDLEDEDSALLENERKAVSKAENSSRLENERVTASKVEDSARLENEHVTASKVKDSALLEGEHELRHHQAGSEQSHYRAKMRVHDDSKAQRVVQNESSKNQLHWKLMLAATALLKNPTMVSTDTEKARWAESFRFLAEHNTKHALRLLRRLERIAQETPKPQISLETLHILTGNPYALILDTEPTTINLDEVKVESQIIEPFESTKFASKATQLRYLRITYPNQKSFDCYAYDYQEDLHTRKASYRLLRPLSETISKTGFLISTLDPSDTRTPLHWAAISGSYEILEAVIIGIGQLNVSNIQEPSLPTLNSPDNQGNTPVHEAALAGSYKTQLEKWTQKYEHNFDGIKYKLSYLAPVRAIPVSFDTFNLLNHYKPDFTARNSKNQTAIHLSIQGDNQGFLEALSAHLDPSFITDIEGDGTNISIAHYAAIKSRSGKMIDRICEKGSIHSNKDVNAHSRDSQGYTPLCYAVAYLNPFAQVAFLKNGANPNTQQDPMNSYSDTPLSIALSTRVRGYNTSSRAVWGHIYPNIEGLNTLLKHEGRNLSPSDPVRVINETELRSFEQTLVYLPLTQPRLAVNKDKEEEDLDESQEYNSLAEAVFNPQKYKKFCTTEGCELLKLNSEQYRHLLLACLPPKPNDHELETALHDYALASTALLLLHGANPKLAATQTALDSAWSKAKKKFNSVQRQIEFTAVNSDTDSLIGESRAKELRQPYLGTNNKPGDPFTTIFPSLEKARDALRVIMTNYVCTDGEPWLTKQVKGDDNKKNEKLRDIHGQLIPLYPEGSWGRFFSDPFRHISEYSPVVYKVLRQLEDFKKDHDGREMTKEELIQIIHEAFWEAQQIFIHSKTNKQTDIKGSSIFDRILVALTLTNKVDTAALAPVTKSNLEADLSFHDEDPKDPEPADYDSDGNSIGYL